ncbi:hypothetical protein ACIQOU_01500 [Streptomyces sp. NPDC091279]|uniref:hypothetical protein n=1 Tax=unclassified Streptomyces TaxID=2593676 RepID=UPI003800A0A2
MTCWNDERTASGEELLADADRRCLEPARDAAPGAAAHAAGMRCIGVPSVAGAWEWLTTGRGD